MVMKIGFISLGSMGTPMAANLLGAHFELTVHNRTRNKEESLAETGARRALDPGAAADDAGNARDRLRRSIRTQAVLANLGGKCARQRAMTRGPE